MRFTARNTNVASRKKPRKQLRLRRVRFVIVVLFSVIIIGAAVSIVRAFGTSILSSQDTVGVVFHTDPALFLHLNRQTDEIVAISIPTDAYVELPRGFGPYRLSAAWRLGEVNDTSGDLFAETLQEVLAVPVHGWISFGDEPLSVSTDTQDALSTLKGKLAKQSFWLGIPGMKTNLSVLDRIILTTSFGKVPVEEITRIAVGETSALAEVTLADDSKVLAIDTKRLDTYLEGVFENKTVREEALGIEVLNATNRMLLGQRAERLVTQLGGRVIRVANAEEEIDACIIKGKEGLVQSNTVEIFSTVFDCSFITIDDDEDRGDIQIIVGSEYAEKLFGQAT